MLSSIADINTKVNDDRAPVFFIVTTVCLGTIPMTTSTCQILLCCLSRIALPSKPVTYGSSLILTAGQRFPLLIT